MPEVTPRVSCPAGFPVLAHLILLLVVVFYGDWQTNCSATAFCDECSLEKAC